MFDHWTTHDRRFVDREMFVSTLRKTKTLNWIPTFHRNSIQIYLTLNFEKLIFFATVDFVCHISFAICRNVTEELRIQSLFLSFFFDALLRKSFAKKSNVTAVEWVKFFFWKSMKWRRRKKSVQTTSRLFSTEMMNFHENSLLIDVSMRLKMWVENRMIDV